MAPYYFDVEVDAPYHHGRFRAEAGDPFPLDPGTCQPAPQTISEHEEDLAARNREIARLPFSWVT